MSSRLASFALVATSSICASLLSAQLVGVGSGSVVARSAHASQANPFSADVITQRLNVLADGNRIEQEMHGKIYRDSQGRYRNENELFFQTGEKHQIISIHDPVAGESITLDPVRKTARVAHSPNPGERPPMPPPQPAVAQERPTNKSERLGHMTIEGLDAIGTKTTHTVPANAIGNAQPLVSVTEIWRSTELDILLVSKTTDPQNGEETRKLVNIQRGEPDPALFQVPADYTVIDMPAR